MANCRKQVGEFIELQCEFESGKVVALAFVTEEKAQLADDNPSLWSDPSFWTSETYSGDILQHNQVSGEYVGADITIPGKGTQGERLGGKTHTLTCQVESVKGNNGYWDDLGISTNYRVVFVGDLYQTLFVSTTNCRISANMVLQNEINSINEWEVICTWSDIRIPESYDVPAGIFE